MLAHQYLVSTNKHSLTFNALPDVGRTYVLGNDSDFFLFKDCRYVNFSDVAFVRHPQRTNKSGQQIVQVAVNLYTRAALSKLLAVSEKFLVDLGIYLGNDYTGMIAPQCADSRPWLSY